MLYELNEHGDGRTYDPTVPRKSDQQLANHELAAQWLAWHKNVVGSSTSTLTSYRSVMNRWCMWLGAQDMLTVTRADMEGFVARPRGRRGEGASGAARTRRRDTTVLRGFYGWAQGEGLTARLLAGNLVSPKITRKEPRPVPDEQWQDVWRSELPPILRVALGLGFFVGLRRSEMASITGDNFQDHRITGFVRKGGSEHTVPWVDMVNTVVSKMPEHRSRWTDLFVDETRDLSKMVGPHALLSPWSQNLGPNTVNRKFEQHGVPFTPHRTRDSCATNLVVHCGVPVHIVMELLHHGSIQVTMGYVQVAASSLGTWLDNQ